MAPDLARQYATDSNLRARQRLWELQQPSFDLVEWVLDLAGLRTAAGSGTLVLDVGCGNGAYLRELDRRGIAVVGCDLSEGMLRAAAPHRQRVNADAVTLPFPDGSFDVVLAPHMLYHVDDRVAAAAELRRVLIPAGTCIAVTNGEDHIRSLRELIEHAVRAENPGWTLTSNATRAFSLENGAEQLRSAFDHVECVRPTGVAPARITDAAVAADYVASVGDLYELATTRPWADVVEDVRDAVQHEIDTNGAVLVRGDPGAFVCS